MPKKIYIAYYDYNNDYKDAEDTIECCELIVANDDNEAHNKAIQLFGFDKLKESNPKQYKYETDHLYVEEKRLYHFDKKLGNKRVDYMDYLKKRSEQEKEQMEEKIKGLEFLLEEERLRPPENGGSEYEKAFDSFNTLTASNKN